MQDVMLDFETLAVGDNACVVQIGAVYFNPETGEIGKTYQATIDPIDAQKNGAVLDASTVLWWLRQDRQAQTQVFGVDGESEKSAFIGLNVFLKNAKRIWAKPPTFDWRILDQTYRRIGLPPLDHRSARCVRTIMDLYDGILPEFMGTPHVALHDAVHQADCLIIAIQHIKGSKIER
jgi:hypothetical protein